MSVEAVAQLLLYVTALWLGLYLIARVVRLRASKPALVLAGFGLAAYAFALAADLLARAASPWALALTRAHWALIFLPAILWSGALAERLPESTPLRALLLRAWRFGLLPFAVMVSALTLSTALVLDFGMGGPRPGLLYPFLFVFVLLPLLAIVALLVRVVPSTEPRRSFALLVVWALFFALSLGLLIFPLDWLPRAWSLLLLGVDLVGLGFSLVWLDAFDEGESLLPDLLRSLLGSSVMEVLFGGLVLAGAWLAGGLSFPWLALLLATLAAAISTAMFADEIQAGLDRLAFARFPQISRARSELRAATEALPRAAAESPLAVDEAEFARLTRRALSQLGNLPRLAASPLTQLPLIERRLAQRGADDNALERAAELKAVLTESIARLKPVGRGDFGVTDEWRHYNALYFPYVLGLKPAARRNGHEPLDPGARQALEWLSASVPERTLYNWQNAAARLVAQHLLELHKAADWQ